jgi:hypothetical protein
LRPDNLFASANDANLDDADADADVANDARVSDAAMGSRLSRRLGPI